VSSRLATSKVFFLNRPVHHYGKIRTTRLLFSNHAGSPHVCSQQPLPTCAQELQMLSFYRFSPIKDPTSIRDELFAAVQNIPGLRGTIYLASEGVNAQLAVPPGEPLDLLLNACVECLPFDPFSLNAPNLGDVVPTTTPTFNRLVVRTRDAVLRDDLGEFLDWNDAGFELTPAEWDQQLRQSNASVLLDCRNLYESEKGTFSGATPLKTQVFQESWQQIRNETKDLDKDEPILIFCTGGIRCVKVGAYLKQKLGFSDVRRLEHGIIGYHRWAKENHVEEQTSMWKGENFLFDKRQSELEKDIKK
jgi:predicted sulfurtransferase